MRDDFIKDGFAKRYLPLVLTFERILPRVNLHRPRQDCKVKPLAMG
ncbi:hypothetical protein ACHAXS_009811, partial [Conticribra weissflogii]